MKVKRKCGYCGKSDHMMRVVDAEYKIFDVRHRVCYKCHPELDSSSVLNGPDGGLKIMKSDLRDSSWDVLETLPKEMSSKEDEEELLT